MKHKKIVFITIIALIVLVSSVNAETLTGTIVGSNYTQKTYGQGYVLPSAVYPAQLKVNDIEYDGSLKAFIFYDDGIVSTYDAGAPAGATTSFTLRYPNDTDKADIIGTGTIGYQRIWNTANPPVEQMGYKYLVFTNGLNLTAIPSGDTSNLYVNYSRSDLYNMRFAAGSSTAAPPATGGIYWSSNPAGTYLLTFENSFIVDYEATKPDGLGITGQITKTSGDLVRGFIFNGTFPYSTLTTESTLSTNTFNFSVPSQSIVIGVQDATGQIYNSSILFYDSPTPTPTVTIPSGYVRTYFENVDGMTTGQIHNSNLQLKDVEAGTWTNYTSDLDGNGYIDTLPSHTINAYGDATGYTSVSRLGLPAFPEGVYSLVMFTSGSMPTTTTGNINLIVLVHDWDTGQPLTAAELKTVLPNGSSMGGKTGDAGQAVFSVPNKSVISVTASKPGYLTATQTVTTSDFGPDSLWMKLSTKTVIPTPTRTVVPGEITVRPTVDPNSPEENNGDTSLKAQEMMNFIANNGLTLVELCFMVTIFALLGVKLGK